MASLWGSFHLFNLKVSGSYSTSLSFFHWGILLCLFWLVWLQVLLGSSQKSKYHCNFHLIVQWQWQLEIKMTWIVCQHRFCKGDITFVHCHFWKFPQSLPFYSHKPKQGFCLFFFRYSCNFSSQYKKLSNFVCHEHHLILLHPNLPTIVANMAPKPANTIEIRLVNLIRRNYPLPSFQ